MRNDWRPSTLPTALQARARLNRCIRDFFEQRGVLEVETPLLCKETATDPYLTSWKAEDHPLYLQTSPEFCMKRLLAAGNGPIYQLCKAFRLEPAGRYHNPEFTMLEWYRPGWSLSELLDEIDSLLNTIAIQFNYPLEPTHHFTYQAAFEQTVGFDPHTSDENTLRHCVHTHINGDFQDLDRDGLLDLLMSHLVEPALPKGPVVINEFPASKAALAQTSLNSDQILIGNRAELYLNGIELVNAYQELTDGQEQEVRFRQDITYRADHNLDPVPTPTELLGALKSGLPSCAGVALGVDRLLMLMTNSSHIKEILSFPHQ